MSLSYSGQNCCAYGCTNRRGHNVDGRQFYRIPADKTRRDMWLAAINRGENSGRWNPAGDHWRICSDHFISGKKSNDPLSPDYVPTIFSHVSSPLKRKRVKDFEAYERRTKRSATRLDNEKKSVAAKALLELSTISEPSEEGDVEPEKSKDDVRGFENHEELIKALQTECQLLRNDLHETKTKLANMSFEESGFLNNDTKVRNMTGLASYSILICIFNVLCPFLKKSSSLTTFQQYIMTLIRIRMNISLTFFANYYNVHITTISRLFSHCINVMYVRLVPVLIKWPEKEDVLESLPVAFRNQKFKNCICIIDCFELFCERPVKLLAQAQTYSTYKSHNTIKYLIGITPQGSVSFISLGWGGRTSDKVITEKSGFLHKLTVNNLVLADRGFDIADSFGFHNAELKIPAFTKGVKQLDPITVEETRGLAAVRIHVERVISAVRQKYTILQSTIPIHMFDVEEGYDVTQLDKIVHICCALVNVSESVVPFD